MSLRDPSPARPRHRSRELARLASALAAAVALVGPETGPAQPVASATDPPPRREPAVEPVPRPGVEPTAADVAGAPVPGEESGRLDRVDGGDSAPRLIGRGILDLPTGRDDGQPREDAEVSHRA